MATTDTKPVTIFVDTREGRSAVPQALARIAGVTVQTKTLGCGDYTVGDDALAIERKTAVDFIASILDRRLMEQAARLSTDFHEAVILLEGDVYSTGSAIAPEAIDGALSWLALLSGLKVLHTPDAQRSATLVHRMAIHVTHGLGYEVPLRGAKPKDIGIAAQFLLEGLPGCGPTTARKILQHFRSPQAALAATDEEFGKVPGLGPKSIAKIREVLGYTIQ